MFKCNHCCGVDFEPSLCFLTTLQCYFSFYSSLQYLHTQIFIYQSSINVFLCFFFSCLVFNDFNSISIDSTSINTCICVCAHCKIGYIQKCEGNEMILQEKKRNAFSWSQAHLKLMSDNWKRLHIFLSIFATKPKWMSTENLEIEKRVIVYMCLCLKDIENRRRREQWNEQY